MMANTSAIWQHAARTTYQLSSPSCSTRAIQKSSSSGSNWILMSRQPHRVTSGKSNSGHKQIHISKLFSHIYISTLCQVKIQNRDRQHRSDGEQ